MDIKKSRKAWRFKFVFKALSFLLIAAFACNLFLYNPTSAASKLTDANVQAMEAKIAEIERKQSEVQSKINSSQSQKYTYAQQKQNLDTQLSLAREKIDATKQLLVEIERSINEKSAEIVQKEAELADLLAKFQQRIRISHENGTAGYLEMILGAKSLSDFLSRVERVGSLLEYDVRVMNQYKEERQNFEQAKLALENTLAEQQTIETNLLAEQQELISQIGNYESQIANLAKDEAAYQAQLRQYKIEEQKENERLEKYIKELEERQKQEYVGGEFMWPLSTNFKWISSRYGARTLYGRYDFHYGIDITGSNIFGAPVYAVNGGTVLISTYHYSYGNYVLINHGGGKSTLYAHMSQLPSVKVGQTVKKGDVIGYVGSTGSSTGPHLHFEIRINGSTVDPLKSGLIVTPPGTVFLN